MAIHLTSTAFALPPDVESVDAILAREAERTAGASLDGLGLREVRVCSDRATPHMLAVEAARTALTAARVTPAVVIDYSTFHGDDTEYVSFAQRLCAELGIESAVSFSFKVGGCGGLHLAIKTAMGLMTADPALSSALLVAADTPPTGSRSLLPVTVQGDAASAVVLTRDGAGPEILASEVVTLSHLHDAITLGRRDGRLVVDVNAERIENAVKPVYFLNFYRLIQQALGKASLALAQVDHVVYSNISRPDRDGFVRALRIKPERMLPGRLEDLGHTFASDLVINYAGLALGPGETALLASAGIGFTWGVTIVRAPA